jgi:hypothetical protein
MKERRETDKPERSADVRSSDIPNAHATGDGAMGRNDEKLDDVEQAKKEESPQEHKNEESVY